MNPCRIKNESLIILVIFGFFVNFLVYPIPIETTQVDNQNSDNDIDCISPDDIFILDMLPVDLDLLFWNDNHTKRDELLSILETELWGWILAPWGAHLTAGHIEGADKWYLTTYRQAEIRAIADGELYRYDSPGETFGTTQGQEVAFESSFTYTIGNNCAINYGHVDLLKTIHDEIESTGTYSFAEDELVGYTHNWTYNFSSFDFYYFINQIESICPLYALNTDLQTEVTNYYDLQYDYAKTGGIHAETDICLDLNIHIENTLWGNWDYLEGPYDSYLAGLEDPPDSFYLTFLNRDFTNPETFWRHPGDYSVNISEAIDGVGLDIDIDIPGFNSFEHCFVEPISGDYSNGIMKMSTWFPSDFGPGNTSIYTKYEISSSSSGYKDDILNIEHFNDLVDAQAGFTTNKTVYKRLVPYWQTGIPTDSTGLDILHSITVLCLVFPVITLVVQRKKNKQVK